MKKYMLFILLASIGAIGYAANQYNWGTSTGASWITPDDTSVAVGAPLQISVTNQPYVRAGGAPLTMFAASSTTIFGLTAGTTGQLVFQNPGLQIGLCISTGVTNASQFVLVFATTTACGK